MLALEVNFHKHETLRNLVDVLRVGLFSAMRIGGLYHIGECVLTSTICVGGFWKFGEIVLTSKKYVGGL